MIDDGFDFVVAMVYPIHEITPNIPPAIIKTDRCSTIGLHSESINKYAYTKKVTMHKTKIVIPSALRLCIALQACRQLFI
jgi:hypothetical protein